jgi:hypothetical protein
VKLSTRIAYGLEYHLRNTKMIIRSGKKLLVVGYKLLNDIKRYSYLERHKRKAIRLPCLQLCWETQNLPSSCPPLFSQFSALASNSVYVSMSPSAPFLFICPLLVSLFFFRTPSFYIYFSDFSSWYLCVSTSSRISPDRSARHREKRQESCK